MKKINAIFILTATLLSISVMQAQRLTRYVNPMVGTGGHGHTFPAATAPFGMVQLGPDTRLDTWDGCSGYHYSDSIIYGFTHTHLSGTGCLDYGDILMMPVVDYTAQTIDNKIYRSTFRHDKEKAAPGYYAVQLDRAHIGVRLTAGRRMGMHEYTYPKNVVQQIIIDLKHRDVLTASHIEQVDAHAVRGFRRSNAWAEGQEVWFYAEFSQPIAQFKNFDNQGALLTFQKNNSKKIVVKVGISSVSSENAAANLHAEVATTDWNFNRLRTRTHAAWEQYLAKIDVTRSCRDRQRLCTFYTALYHTAIHPSLYSDVNGEYRGMDHKVHHADGFERYTVFSLWDTFRALHPLLTTIERNRTRDFIKSFQSIYNENGKLPVWELSGCETNCMIGYHAVSVIADAVVKGIDDFDVATLFEAMEQSAQEYAFGINVFHNHGAVLADREHESVSKTLEYAYDDWCIAQVADYLYRTTGKADYAKKRDRHLQNALFYRNLFDPSTGFMRPRLNGCWLQPFDPYEVNNHYTEANAWQYSFFVPQDVEGHIRLLGGDSAYCAKLDALFSAVERTTGRTQADITGMVGQYAHGNEPSHHIPFLYTYAGQPWKTQSMVRRLLSEMYTPQPDGLCGNEDCGQMSAWYVMSAMGLYAVTPGSDLLVLTTPLFKEVKINLENGQHLTISSHFTGNIDNAPYIVSSTLNGTPHNKAFVRFNDILSGKHLQFELASTPNQAWGSAIDDRPHSLIKSAIVINPWFVMESNIFHSEMEVFIASSQQDERIYYRIDSGIFVRFNPDQKIIVNESCTIEAYAETSDGRRSMVSVVQMHRLPENKRITLHSRYNPQYSAGGMNAQNLFAMGQQQAAQQPAHPPAGRAPAAMPATPASSTPTAAILTPKEP